MAPTGSTAHTAPTGQAGPTATSVVAQRAGAPVRQSASGTSSLSGADIDFIVRELEQRVLAELDRRGGRYAGSF